MFQSIKRIFCGDDRPWKRGFERLPQVSITDDRVQIDDFRNFRYSCDGKHDSHYETRHFNVCDVRTLDFIVVPFQASSRFAHTMMSFGFDDGAHAVVSVEARLRRGQKYSLLKGLLGFYSIMYVIADERDAIGHRTEYRGNEVFLYRVAAEQTELEQLFCQVMRYAEKLPTAPERYNTLINNCATSIRYHVNSIWPGQIPWGWGVLMPGRADFLAYRLGLLKSNETFQQTRQRARINDLAAGNWHDERFSQLIRAKQVLIGKTEFALCAKLNGIRVLFSLPNISELHFGNCVCLWAWLGDRMAITGSTACRGDSASRDNVRWKYGRRRICGRRRCCFATRRRRRNPDARF